MKKIIILTILLSSFVSAIYFRDKGENDEYVVIHWEGGKAFLLKGFSLIYADLNADYNRKDYENSICNNFHLDFIDPFNNL